MPKDKTRGSRRKSRRLTDFASDVEMLEVDLPRSERLKPRAKNRPGFPSRHEGDRRSRAGRGATPAQPPPGGPRGSQAARGSSATAGRRNLRAHTAGAAAAAAATPALDPFAPRGGRRSRQLSALSAASAAAQPGPWCDGCNRLNRQLHGYLLDVLRTGEQAVDEWAYAVGASPDHMECEPAPERIIPEGYRRCSQQCQSCVARRPGGGPGAATPPTSSAGWSSTALGTPAAASGHPDQLGMINEAQTGGGPYAQAGPGSAFARATPGSTPSPPGSSTRINHQLVAVPEGQSLLHARWAGPPAQTQLPLPAQQPLLAQQPWGGSP